LVVSPLQEVLMWFYILLFIVLAAVTTYVIVRDKRHPVDHPTKSDGWGWGNTWPR
jgi:hypothetical protein